MSFTIRCSESGKVVGSAYSAEFARQLSSELAEVVGNPLVVDLTRSGSDDPVETNRVPARAHLRLLSH